MRTKRGPAVSPNRPSSRSVSCYDSLRSGNAEVRRNPMFMGVFA